MSVTTIDRSGNDTNGCLSYPHFQVLAQRSRAFSGIAAFTNETFGFFNGREAVELQAARVSSNLFDLLGVRPTVGRTFMTDEDKAGGEPVALVSDGLWRKNFRGDPNVVGHSMALDSRAYTIIGVVPASFQFELLGTDIDVWLPHTDALNVISPQQIQSGACYLNGVARLAPGVPIEQAQAEMKLLDQQYIRAFPKMSDADQKRPVEVMPLRTKLIGNFRSAFLILQAAVTLVLLIACANVAGLLLTRALKRRREVAIRIALGARRAQLLMQFLTESVLLALLGGTGGAALSLAATHAFVRTAVQSFPRMAESPTGVDWGVLAFTFGVSILSGVLFGLPPALQVSSTNVSASLRGEGRGTVGARSHKFSRNLLVTGQIALSLILLVGAGLLIRSFILLESQSLGFNTQNVLTMSIALPPSKYSKPDQLIDFFDQLVGRIAALPGVKAAAVSSALPLSISRLTPIQVEGQPAVPLAERPIIIAQTFTSSYLGVMRIPLLEGRFFGAYDRHDSLPVIVVNQKFARRFFPGQEAIGKHVWIGRSAVPAQIAGVIGNIKNVGLSIDSQPEFDVPFSQRPWPRMNLIVRTAGDPKRFANAVRLQISKLDRDLPATTPQTIEELLAEANTQPRMIMTLLTAFAVFAFVLAIVGLYGVISYSVTQRTQEMAVRIALGATGGNLLRLVLGYGALVSCVGIGIGITVSLLLSSLIKGLIYGIGPKDPITFCVVPLVFLICALIASYVPARLAMRVDVIEALKG